MKIMLFLQKIKATKTKIKDICDFVNCKTVIDDDIKLNLIKKRKPCDAFKFPSQEYNDKRRPNGVMQRSCQQQWFSTFHFLSYSQQQDGLYYNFFY